MISLTDSEIKDILPLNLAEQPEVQAISYAIKLSQKRILEKVLQSMIYAAIDDLPEKIVDVLAAELRAQYYDQALPIENKRQIVKNALYIYSKAGTPEAVEKRIRYIFGTGEVHEWFETGGAPGTFSLSIPETRTEEAFEKFRKMIDGVKNARSHLEHINFGATTKAEAKAGLSPPVTVMFLTVK